MNESVLFWYNQKIKLLATLIYHHIPDSITWCRLQQVSSRFNQVGKKKLVQKEKSNLNYKDVWTELPNGLLHGIHRTQSLLNHKIVHEHYMVNGKIHGVYKEFCEIPPSASVQWNPQNILSAIKNTLLIYAGLRQPDGGEPDLVAYREYSHGKFHGTHKTWYPNGQLLELGNYYNGFRHGNFRTWEMNGQIVADDYYHYGKLHGVGTRWDSNGTLLWCQYYEGRLIHPVTF